MAQETSNFYKAYQLAHQGRTLFLKKSILAIIIIVSFVLGSVFFTGFLNDFSNVNLLVLTIVFWTIGFSLLPIFFLVIPIYHFLLWNLVISLAPFLPFILKAQWDIYLFIVSGLIFLLFLLSRANIKGESNNLLGIKWRRIVSQGSLQILLSLVIILLSLFYFQGKFQGEPELIKQSAEEAVAEATINSTISTNEETQSIFGIQLNQTVDEILKSYIEKQMFGLTSGMEEAAVVDDALMKEVLTETKSKISQLLGLSLTGEEKISSLITDWIKTRWQTISLPLKAGLVFIIFLLLLSILRFINIFFSIALVFLSWILLQILLSVNYLTIKRTGVEKQEIAIKPLNP